MLSLSRMRKAPLMQIRTLKRKTSELYIRVPQEVTKVYP